MNYNYPQPQFPMPAQSGTSVYRPVAPYAQWPQVPSFSGQVRPVSSIEEVRACPIDFDGSVFYFTDIANKKIYTKQINLDGTVAINLYELKDFTTADQHSNAPYVTRQEFDETIMKFQTMFESLNPKAQEPVQTAAAQPNIKYSF